MPKSLILIIFVLIVACSKHDEPTVYTQYFCDINNAKVVFDGDVSQCSSLCEKHTRRYTIKIDDETNLPKFVFIPEEYEKKFYENWLRSINDDKSEWEFEEYFGMRDIGTGYTITSKIGDYILSKDYVRPDGVDCVVEFESDEDVNKCIQDNKKPISAHKPYKTFICAVPD
jgi:hypothetical protein